MFTLKLIATLVFLAYKFLSVPVVHQDPLILPPVADRVEADKDPALFINISKDGTFSHKEKTITNKQITELCKAHKAKHPKSIVKIRCHKNTNFKHVSTVVRAASDGGMEKNIVKISGDKLQEPAQNPQKPAPAKIEKPAALEKVVGKTIRPREQDLKMSLPKGEDPPAFAPMLIHVAKNGTISIRNGKNKETLDVDPKIRQLPELQKRLKIYVANARAGGNEPLVQILAENDTKQQRIIDVLNALAAQKINKVTFTDLVDAK